MKKLYDPGEGVSLKVRFLGSLIVVIFFILLGIVVMFVAKPYYNDGRALGVPFLILLSGIFLLLAFAFRKQMLRVVNKPTTPMNSLSSGDVEIVGKVKPVGKTIISPTGQNCVYYAAYWIDTVVVSHTSENTHTTSVQVGHEVSNSSFVIISIEFSELILSNISPTAKSWSFTGLSIKLIIALATVDLPEPDSPTIPSISPL